MSRSAVIAAISLGTSSSLPRRIVRRPSSTPPRGSSPARTVAPVAGGLQRALRVTADLHGAAVGHPGALLGQRDGEVVRVDVAVRGDRGDLARDVLVLAEADRAAAVVDPAARELAGGL